MADRELTPEEIAEEQVAVAVGEVVAEALEEDDVLGHSAAWSINVGCSCASA